ncbi:MAG TPA: DNA-directed RNA polymerase subunit omega [Thermoanaerobaculia bacterium]|nr:DNA-directed RNA polymerase subunit omega [Thermoanaerobaculia bacterium]
MDRLPEGIDSKFRYVLLVSKRAEDLIEGSPTKLRTRFAKPTRIAMEEIDQKAILWSLTPPPEPESDFLDDEE